MADLVERDNCDVVAPPQMLNASFVFPLESPTLQRQWEPAPPDLGGGWLGEEEEVFDEFSSSEDEYDEMPPPPVWNQAPIWYYTDYPIEELVYQVDDSLSMDDNIAAYNEHQAAVLFYRNMTPPTSPLIQSELERRERERIESQSTQSPPQNSVFWKIARKAFTYISIFVVAFLGTLNLVIRRRQFEEELAREEEVWAEGEEEDVQPSDPHTSEEAGAQQEVKEADQTTLVENRGETVASPGEQTSPPLSDIAFTDPAITFPQFLDRWNNIGTFEWLKSDEDQKIIKAYDFPRDALAALKNNPSILPLEQYLYFRPNMTIRFQVNSTKFHQGMLIFGVKYYSSTSSHDQRTPTKAYQLWQLDYATAQAAASSVVTIEIPFASFLDQIPIRNGLVGSSCYYASVYVGVASPLLTGPNSCNTVTVTTQVKFSTENYKTELFGQVSRMPVFAEGVLSDVKDIAKSVEGSIKGLGSIFKSMNEDKPVDPREAEPVLDYPTVSYSSGEGTTHAKIMRLVPNTIAPHKPGTVPNSFSRLSEIDLCNKWGYVTKFVLTTSQEAEHQNWSTPIHPLLGYRVSESEFLPTPTAGVAGLYSYWSGEIQFKFIVIKAGPHSVRLRFSVSPMGELTGEEQINVQSVIQDFEEQAEIDYSAPYLSPVKMMPTFYNGQAFGAGVLQVRLESKLICMDAVAQSVEVLVLMRAPNLQLAVPRNSIFRPLISTTINSTLRAEFVNPQRTQVEEGMWADSSYTTKYIQGDSTLRLEFPGIAFLSIGKKFTTQPKYNKDQQKYLVFVELATWENLAETVPPKAQWTQEKVKLQKGEVTAYAIVRAQLGGEPLKIVYNNDTVQAEGATEREASPNPQDSHLVVRKANYPDVLLGETFPLQSALRRYQTIASGNHENGGAKFGRAVMIYDVNFGSVALREADRDVDNLTFVHDGFRFAKGSLNYVFIVRSSVTSTGVVSPMRVQVEHIPAGLSTDPVLRPDFILEEDSSIDYIPQTILAHELVQSGTTTIPYNVPYYNYVNYLVNGYDPEANGIASRAAYASGQVRVTVFTPPMTKFEWELKRAMGDDADMYCFQGWPICANYTSVVNVNTQQPIQLAARRKAVSIREEKNLAIAEGEEVTQTKDGEEGGASILSMVELAVATLPPGPRKRAIIRRLVKKAKRHVGYGVVAETSQEELTEQQKREVDLLLQALADRFLKQTAVECFTPFTSKLVSKNNQHSLEIFILNQDAAILAKAVCLEVAGDLYSKFSNCPTTFYTLTKTPVPEGGYFQSLRKAYTGVSSYVSKKVMDVLSSTFPLIEVGAGLGGGAIQIIFEALMTVLKDPMVVFDIVRDLAECWAASDMWVKALGLMHLMMKFGWLNLKGIAAASALVWLLYQTRPVKRGYYYLYAQGEGFIGDRDELRKNMTQWCSALMGGVSAAFGFLSARDWPSAMDKMVSNFARTTNGWHKMLSDSCVFVMDYIVYLLGYDRPDISGLTELKDNPVDLVNWSERVIQITDPTQRDKVLSYPKLRAEVSELYDQGGRVIRLLTADPNPPKATHAFYNLWKMLSDLYQEIGMVSTTVAANTAPICVWIYGEPGIGKSELAKHYALQIAKALDITYEGDPFYVRNPRPFWDGYTAQPILIYDDALQVDSQATHDAFISEWFSLLTNAPFSPEFAGITEKKKFVKPRVVIVCSNQKTPSSIKGVSDVKAFLRRRDVLIEAQFSQEFQQKFPGIKFVTDPRVVQQNYDLSSFGHLRFGHYADVTATDAKPTVWLDYKGSVELSSKTAKTLSKSRLELAKRAVEASNCLSVDNVARTRESLVADISTTDAQEASTSAATTIVNAMTTTLQAEGEEQYSDVIGPTIVKDLVDESEECMFDCDQAVKAGVICHCKVTNKGQYQICYKHGHIVYQMFGKSQLNQMPFVLGRAPPKVGDMAGSCCTPEQYNKARQDNITTCNEQHLKVLGPAYTPICFGPENTLSKPARKVPSSIQVLANYLKEKVSSIWNLIPMKYVIMLVVAAGLGFLFKSLSMLDKLKGAYSKVFGKSKDDEAEEVEANMASSGSVNTHRVGKAHIVTRAEGHASDEIPRVQRQMFDMSVIWSNGRKFTMGGMWIKGRVGVTPYHLWAPPDSGVHITSVRVITGVKTGRKVEMEFGPNDVKVDRIHVSGDEHPLDLAVVKVLSRRLPLAPDMTKSISDRTTVSRLCLDGTLIARNGSDIITEYKMLTRMVKYQNVFGGLASQIRGYAYETRGIGMCGSLLLDNKSAKVIGLHVAGSGTQGYSIRLLYEDLEPFLDEELTTTEQELAEGDHVHAEGAIIPLGLVGKSEVLNSPLKSKIGPSECYGLLTEPVRFPVKFRTQGEEVPGLEKLRKGIEKMASPTKVWPRDTFEKVVEWRKNKILTVKPVLQRIGTLSIQQALFGIPGNQYYPPLKMNTSSGFPLCGGNKPSAKYHYVEYELTADGFVYKSLDPRLEELYQEEIEQRKKGIVPFSPYAVFMKDERLKPGKDPRLIEGCPFQQTILFRQYTLDFFAAYTKAYTNIGHAIGINVHGPQWSELARLLQERGEYILCGDYSGFGPGLDTSLILAFGDIINDWYNMYSTGRDDLAEANMIRRTLFESLAFSQIVARDTVYQTICGSPSGNPATVQINSEVNSMMLGCAWLEMFRGTSLGDLCYYDLTVTSIVYGDDLIASVHPNVVEHFNNETLQNIFRKFGVKYTDADKSGQIRRYCSLADASFLKCQFLPHPTRGEGFYLAGLEKPMIEDIVNWVHYPVPNLREASIENCIAACDLAYGHGPEYFGKIKQQITSYWLSKGKSISVRSWDYLDSLFFGELLEYEVTKVVDPISIQWA